jgi:hypothetical protein
MTWNNVATFVMTMVRVRSKGPPCVGDGSSEPSNKGQPNRFNHSIGEHKWWSWRPSNPKKARTNVGSMGGGREPPRQPIPTMTKPVGPWIGPPWTTWYPPWCHVAPSLLLMAPSNWKSFPYPIYSVGTNLDAHVRVF